MKVRKIAIKTVVVLAVLLALASVTNTTLAQYSPSVPPTPIVVRETPITVSYTEPRRVITIDVTQFDPEQVVKKITLTLKEPVPTASFTIYLLAERPPEVWKDPEETALFYFTIRGHVLLLENIESATITFVVEKDVADVDMETITLSGFFEGAWEESPTKKIGADEKFLYFEAEAPGLSHFAATGVAPSTPTLITMILPLAIVVIVVVAVVAVVAIYRRRVGSSQKGSG